MPFLYVNLNTSHVLIYRFTTVVYEEKGKFKYISCSYLSIPTACATVFIALFKYISCSYLSAPFICPVAGFMHLNTSHVLIYHKATHKAVSFF